MLSLRRGNCRPRSDIRGRRSLRSLGAPASALLRSIAAGDGARHSLRMPRSTTYGRRPSPNDRRPACRSARMGRAPPGPVGRSGHPCRSSRPTAGVAARRRLYKQFLLRNERDVRALFAPRLAADGVAQHAEAAFDFLADGTLLRAVTSGWSTRRNSANAPRMPLPRWSIRPGSRMPRTVTRSGDYSGPPSAGGWTSCPGGELFSQFLSRRRLSTTIPMAKRANITTIAAVTLQW